MKLVMIFFNVAIESVVMKFLEALDITAYTKFTNVLGAGTHSSPKLNTIVWPGMNTGLFVMTEEKKKDEIMEGIRALKMEYGREGLKAVVLDVSEST